MTNSNLYIFKTDDEDLIEFYRSIIADISKKKRNHKAEYQRNYTKKLSTSLQACKE
jgi:putative ubiquitin-RnfH superfamily antitoxin RatB of RatAB toxin-antitoxin module